MSKNVHDLIDGKKQGIGTAVVYSGSFDCCLRPDSGNQEVEVEISDTDFGGTEPYAVSNQAIGNCCGEHWVSGTDLRLATPPPPPFDVTKAPLPTQLAVALNVKVQQDDITVADIKKALAEIQRLLVEEVTGTGKQFRGLCTACMTDVHIVGGALEHVDKRNCLTAAIMVTN